MRKVIAYNAEPDGRLIIEQYTPYGERNVIVILPEYIDTFIEKLKQKVSSEGTGEIVKIGDKPHTFWSTPIRIGND